MFSGVSQNDSITNWSECLNRLYQASGKPAFSKAGKYVARYFGRVAQSTVDFSQNNTIADLFHKQPQSVMQTIITVIVTMIAATLILSFCSSTSLANGQSAEPSIPIKYYMGMESVDTRLMVSLLHDPFLPIELDRMENYVTPINPEVPDVLAIARAEQLTELQSYRDERLEQHQPIVKPKVLPKPVYAVAAAQPISPPEPVYREFTVLSYDELDRAASEAGWPNEDGWWPQMRYIITQCENGSLNPNAHNTSDPSGGSVGLAQLNAGWFSYLGEDPAERYNPVVNLRTALKLRQRIGGFGTGAGWTCFYKLGMDLRYER